MERVNSLPRVVSLVVLLVVLAAGILAPRPLGGLAFLLVTVFVGWLLFLTWPRLTVSERMMRTAVLLLVFAVAVIRTVPGSAG